MSTVIENSIESSIQNPCALCLEIPDTETESYNFCTNESHNNTCKPCLLSYVNSFIKSAKRGSCPRINCPYPHKNKKKRILKYEKLSDVLDEDTKNSYKDLAKSLVVLLCGTCHKNSSSFVEYTSPATDKSVMQKYFSDQFSKSGKMSEFVADICLYETGILTTEEIYQKIISTYFQSAMGLIPNDRWKIFREILASIVNPERSVNLQLRYYRDFHEMKTSCCDSLHCFRCKIKGGHGSKSCTDMESSQNNVIVSCPTCRISLVKGDGCDTITCVCGSVMSWSAQQRISKYISDFLQNYPDNPDLKCVEILCSSNISAYVNHAIAWKQINELAISTLLKSAFLKMYPFCPARGYLICEFEEDLSYGIEEGAKCWARVPSNERQISHATDQKSFLRKTSTLFETMYSSIEDRLFHSNNDVFTSEPMTNSSMNWRKKNEKLLKSWISNETFKNCRQFLALFGNRDIQFMYNVKNKMEQYRSIKNKKVYSTSTSDEKFVIVIDEIEPDDVFILTVEPWSTNKKSYRWVFEQCSSYNKKNFKGVEKVVDVQLKQGDVLMGTFDTMLNLVGIALNTEAIISTFPIGSVHKYKVIIETSKKSETRSVDILCSLKTSHLSKEQFRMFCDFKEYCKKLIDDEDNITESDPKLFGSEEEFLRKCGGDESKAIQLYQSKIEPCINKLFYAVADVHCIKMTFRDIICGIRWKRSHKFIIKQQENERLASEFYNEYQENSPYYAATICFDHQNSSEPQCIKAMAYIQVNKELMKDWYAYDLLSSDPLISSIVNGCTCIPPCNRRYYLNCKACV